MNIQSVLWKVFLFLVVLTQVGCQAKTEFWINPDGTGKVVLDYVYQPRLDVLTTYPANLQAEKLLANWSGIDHWSNVVFTPDQASFHLKATGYFKDIGAVHNRGQFSIMTPTFVMEDGKVTGVTFEADPSPREGLLYQSLFGLAESRVDSVSGFRAFADRFLLSDTAFNHLKMESLRSMRCEYIVHLPGTIKSSSLLERMNSHTVRLVIDGGKYLDYCLQELRNDDTVGKLVDSNSTAERFYDDPTVFAAYIDKTFGGKPVTATLEPVDKPLFDYPTEASKVIGYEKGMTDAGLVNSELSQVKAGRLGKADVVKAQLSGRALSIQVTTAEEYPFFIRDGEATKIVADDGTVLAPSMTQDRHIGVMTGETRVLGDISNERLSREATLSFTLATPVSKIKLFRGFFLAIDPMGSSKVNLGALDLRPGSATNDRSLFVYDVRRVTDKRGTRLVFDLADKGNQHWFQNFSVNFSDRSESGLGSSGIFGVGYGYEPVYTFDLRPGVTRITNMTTTQYNPKLVMIPIELHDISGQ